MKKSKRGYFGIGIYGCKKHENIGTLWRSAYQLGASFIFTINARYTHQATDTVKAHRHIPFFQYDTFDGFLYIKPLDCPVVAVETGSTELTQYTHLERCIYLLGAEDTGLPDIIQKQCHSIVTLPAIRVESYNVAVAGSLVMYDRLLKQGVKTK